MNLICTHFTGQVLIFGLLSSILTILFVTILKAQETKLKSDRDNTQYSCPKMTEIRNKSRKYLVVFFTFY